MIIRLTPGESEPISVKVEIMRKKRKYRHSRQFLDKQRALQRKFLEAFRKTGRHVRACEMAGTSYEAVAHWRKTCPAFDKAYLESHESLRVLLVDAAVKRAVEGVPKGVYYEGDRIDTEIEYSDVLLGRLLAAHDKRFRSGFEADAGGSMPKVVVISYANADTADTTPA